MNVMEPRNTDTGNRWETDFEGVPHNRPTRTTGMRRRAHNLSLLGRSIPPALVEIDPAFARSGEVPGRVW